MCVREREKGDSRGGKGKGKERMGGRREGWGGGGGGGGDDIPQDLLLRPGHVLGVGGEKRLPNVHIESPQHAI